jgi:hypothetical protein
MTGIKAAEEALQIYGTLNQKPGEVEAWADLLRGCCPVVNT